MSELQTSERCESARPPQPSLRTAEGSGSSSLVKRLVAVFGLWAAVTAAYWPSSLALDALWRNTSEESYTHGYLVLLTSLWLIVRDRNRLATEPVRPRPGALVVLVLMSAVWTWSWRASIQEAHLVLVPLILFTAAVAALGWRIARVLAFPIGYLYFAVPIWSDANGFLRTLSARMVGGLIWLTGLPAYVSGDLIHLPAGLIEIAGGCSGLHEFIVGLALAALYGEITEATPRRRFLWLGVMGGLSLIVNWVRIFVVIFAAYVSDMHSSLVRHHYWLGWWLFAFAFAGFLCWAERRSAGSSSVQLQNDRQRIPGIPMNTELRGAHVRPAHVALALAGLVLIPAVAYGIDWAHSARVSVAIQWPAPPKGWSAAPPEYASEWNPYFVRPGGESRVSFTAEDGLKVQAFAVAYRVQSQHAKLLGYWNHLLGDTGALRRQSVRTVDSSSGKWRETLTTDPTGRRSLVWSRYRVGTRSFVRARVSQLWYGLVAVIEPPPIASLMALYTPCRPNCPAARARLSAASVWLRPTLR